MQDIKGTDAECYIIKFFFFSMQANKFVKMERMTNPI